MQGIFLIAKGTVWFLPAQLIKGIAKPERLLGAGFLNPISVDAGKPSDPRTERLERITTVEHYAKDLHQGRIFALHGRQQVLCVKMAQDGDHRRTAGWPLEPPRMRSKGCRVLEPTPAVS